MLKKIMLLAVIISCLIGPAALANDEQPNPNFIGLGKFEIVIVRGKEAIQLKRKVGQDFIVDIDRNMVLLLDTLTVDL